MHDDGKNEKKLDLVSDDVFVQIKDVVQQARSKVEKQVNVLMLYTYWHIGKIIVENEQNGSSKSKYGKSTLKELSKKLSAEVGKGFSLSNLQFMRRFYLEYPNQQTVSVKLGWGHYCELLSVSDTNARGFYERESENSNWTVRELRRQIDTSLFERLLLSDGEANKQKVLQMSQEGIMLSQPEDILKDPYVFEFLGVRENKPVFEKDLEKMLIDKIENFLLELGRGFMFVGSQQRITLGNTHYYVDMQTRSTPMTMKNR